MENVLKNMADVTPHCAKVVHIVPPCDKVLMLSTYIIYATIYPVKLRASYPWLLTGYLYHARFSQDLHMNHGSPMAGRSHKMSTKVREITTNNNASHKWCSMHNACLPSCIYIYSYISNRMYEYVCRQTDRHECM